MADNYLKINYFNNTSKTNFVPKYARKRNTNAKREMTTAFFPLHPYLALPNNIAL